VPSHLEDTPQKIAFVEGRWLAVPGGSAAAEATDETIYLSATLRNVGAGIAVLHGWRFYRTCSSSGSRLRRRSSRA
jgi:hypothetical protein